MPIDAQGLKADSIRQSVSNSLFDEFQTWLKWYESRAVLGYGYLASLRSLFVNRCNGRRSTATGVARFGLSDIMSLSPCLTREKDFFMPCLSGCRRFSSSYFGPPEGILAGNGDMATLAVRLGNSDVNGRTGDRATDQSECTSTLNEFFFRNKAIYYFGDRDRRRR